MKKLPPPYFLNCKWKNLPLLLNKNTKKTRKIKREKERKKKRERDRERERRERNGGRENYEN